MSTFLASSGFLQSRGSLVLDAVFLAMLAISFVLILSIYLVKRGKYEAHRKIQIGLSAVLLIAILVFEVDVRFITDWRALAAQSSYYESGIVGAALLVHLIFAIPTPIVWGFVLFKALRRFSRPPRPGEHSRQHKLWGWIAASMMLATTTTGCIFYWLAFVA